MLQDIQSEILARRSEVAAPTSDRGKWDDLLRMTFTGWTLVNWTDFDYGKCYTFEIVMLRGAPAAPGSATEERELLRALGGSRASLLLKLSAIAPYYLLCVVVREFDEHGATCERYGKPRNKDEWDLWERAADFAESNNFASVGLETLSELVPGIELELAEPGTVTVYNCLFEDQVNGGPLPCAT